MIDRQHALPITHQAKLLKVSRGSVYYLPKPVNEADLALMRRMGIEALAPQPGTSKAAPGNKIYPYCCASWTSIAPTRSGRWTRPTVSNSGSTSRQPTSSTALPLDHQVSDATLFGQPTIATAPLQRPADISVT